METRNRAGLSQTEEGIVLGPLSRLRAGHQPVEVAAGLCGPFGPNLPLVKVSYAGFKNHHLMNLHSCNLCVLKWFVDLRIEYITITVTLFGISSVLVRCKWSHLSASEKLFSSVPSCSLSTSFLSSVLLTLRSTRGPIYLGPSCKLGVFPSSCLSR